MTITDGRVADAPAPAAGTAAAEGAGVDRATVEAAWHGLADRMRAIAYRMLRDRHEAEDVAQEVLVVAFRSAGMLRDPARLEAWLVRIARNVASNAARRARRLRPDLRLSGAEAEESDGTPLPDSAVVAPDPPAETLCILNDAWDDAPPVWRDAFRKRVLLGHDLASIAADQGVSVPCVKTRISRVRRRLEEAVDVGRIVRKRS